MTGARRKPIGWTHVAFVDSMTTLGDTYEIRRWRASGRISCACKSYQWAIAPKSCKHLRALGLAAAVQVRAAVQTESVMVTIPEHVTHRGVVEPAEVFRVRRSISLSALEADEIAEHVVAQPTIVTLTIANGSIDVVATRLGRSVGSGSARTLEQALALVVDMKRQKLL